MILTCIRHDRHARPFRSTESLTGHQDRPMLVHHRRDLVAGQPARRRRAENPKPGRESTTTPKASEDAVPCADGPASSGSSFQCSRNKLGQQQRQRIWPGTGRVHYMHRDPVHLDTHLSELVETSL